MAHLTADLLLLAVSKHNRSKKSSQLDSFKSSWTDPYIKEILYPTLTNSTLL